MTDILMNNQEIIIAKQPRTFTKNKNKLFVKERKEILDKILNIIEITDMNKQFYSHIIDVNEYKKNEIMNLSDDIKKYFKTSS